MRALPEALRPYEKAEALGTEQLSDGELLAVLIRSGTRAKTALELGNELLLKSGGLAGLSGLTLREISETPGIGRVKAIGLKCALELGKRVSRERRISRTDARTAGELVKLYSTDMRGEREVFRIVLLDNQARIIGDALISMGTSDRTLVSPKEVFSEALKRRAASVVAMHNHPSGVPEPSAEDLQITERLADAGDVVGVPLADHIIFAGDRYYSFYEHGRLMRTAKNWGAV